MNKVRPSRYFIIDICDGWTVLLLLSDYKCSFYTFFYLCIPSVNSSLFKHFQMVTFTTETLILKKCVTLLIFTNTLVINDVPLYWTTWIRPLPHVHLLNFNCYTLFITCNVNNASRYMYIQRNHVTVLCKQMNKKLL